MVKTYKDGKKFKTFEIVYGLAGWYNMNISIILKSILGSGKTHYIRRRIADHIMKHTKSGVRHQMLSINETFNIREAIRNLQNLPLVACDVMFHLNINLILPPVSYFYLIQHTAIMYFRKKMLISKCHLIKLLMTLIGFSLITMCLDMWKF